MIRTRRLIALALGVSAAALLMCAPTALLHAATEAAYEAEAGAGHAGGHHGTDWKTFGLAVLNFGVLVFLLRRYAGPLIQNFFFQRSEQIRKQLEQAQSRLREAEAEREDLRRRLRGIEAESQHLIDQVTEQAARERERAFARAEQTIERIGGEAQRVADREIERARIALQAEAATLAAGLAAQILRERVGPQDHDRLFDEFIARAEASA